MAQQDDIARCLDARNGNTIALEEEEDDAANIMEMMPKKMVS